MFGVAIRCWFDEEVDAFTLDSHVVLDAKANASYDEVYLLNACKTVISYRFCFNIRMYVQHLKQFLTKAVGQIVIINILKIHCYYMQTWQRLRPTISCSLSVLNDSIQKIRTPSIF